MSDLTFNLTAFLAPTNQREYIALLDEAIRIGEDLSAQIDAIGVHLKRVAQTA